MKYLVKAEWRTCSRGLIDPVHWFSAFHMFLARTKESTNPSPVLQDDSDQGPGTADEGLCARVHFGKDEVQPMPRWNAFCFYAADASKSISGVRIRSTKPQAAYVGATLVCCAQRWRCTVATSSLQPGVCRPGTNFVSGATKITWQVL